MPPGLRFAGWHDVVIQLQASPDSVSYCCKVRQPAEKLGQSDASRARRPATGERLPLMLQLVRSPSLLLMVGCEHFGHWQNALPFLVPPPPT